MLLFVLSMLACGEEETTDTQVRDTGVEDGLSEEELDNLRSWENTPIRPRFVIKTAFDGSETESQGDRVVVFVPLEEAGQLPDLSVLHDLALDSDGEAAAKAQDHNASRSNTTSSVAGGGVGRGGHVTLLKAFAMAWDDGEPCLGVLEECLSLGSPTEMSMDVLEADLESFEVGFGHSFKMSEHHGGAVQISKRIDQSTPLLASGNTQTGWEVDGQAQARFLLYDGDRLVGSHGPYVDWEEILRILEGVQAPSSVSGTLVEGGMLLTLGWGFQETSEEGWAEMETAWEKTTQDEQAWVEGWEPAGAVLWPELKNAEVDGLGMGASGSEELSLTRDVRGQTHGQQNRLMAVGVTGGELADGAELELDGESCELPCSSARQEGNDLVLRKRPGRISSSMGWGGPQGDPVLGDLVLRQGGDSMIIRYSQAGQSVSFTSDSGVCVAAAWQKGRKVSETEVECDVSYSFEGDLPAGLESDFDGKQYWAYLVF